MKPDQSPADLIFFYALITTLALAWGIGLLWLMVKVKRWWPRIAVFLVLLVMAATAADFLYRSIMGLFALFLLTLLSYGGGHS